MRAVPVGPPRGSKYHDNETQFGKDSSALCEMPTEFLFSQAGLRKACLESEGTLSTLLETSVRIYRTKCVEPNVD